MFLCSKVYPNMKQHNSNTMLQNSAARYDDKFQHSTVCPSIIQYITHWYSNHVALLASSPGSSCPTESHSSCPCNKIHWIAFHGPVALKEFCSYPDDHHLNETITGFRKLTSYIGWIFIYYELKLVDAVLPLCISWRAVGSENDFFFFSLSLK